MDRANVTVARYDFCHTLTLVSIKNPATSPGVIESELTASRGNFGARDPGPIQDAELALALRGERGDRTADMSGIGPQMPLEEVAHFLVEVDSSPFVEEIVGLAAVAINLVLYAGLFERGRHLIGVTHVGDRIVSSVPKQHRHPDMGCMMDWRRRAQRFAIGPPRSNQNSIGGRVEPVARIVMKEGIEIADPP